MPQREAVGGPPLRIVKKEKKVVPLRPLQRGVVFDSVWPIGSLFIGTVSTDPARLLRGGIWSAVQSGIWASIGAIDLYIWQRTS